MSDGSPLRQTYPYFDWLPFVQVDISRADATPFRRSFLVDSGATRSCISRFLAEISLGLTSSDLIDVENGAELADGSRVEAWTTTELLTCELLDHQGEPTGMAFEMDPLIFEDADFLLGQQDFFTAFDVAFNGAELLTVSRR